MGVTFYVRRAASAVACTLLSPCARATLAPAPPPPPPPPPPAPRGSLPSPYTPLPSL